MTQAVPKIEATERVRKRIERLRALAERPGTKEEGETARRLLDAMLAKYAYAPAPTPPTERRRQKQQQRPSSRWWSPDAPFESDGDYVNWHAPRDVSGRGDWLPAYGARSFEFAVDEDGALASVTVKSGTGYAFLDGDLDVEVTVRRVDGWWAEPLPPRGRVSAGDVLIVTLQSYLHEAHRVSVTVEVTPMGNSR